MAGDILLKDLTRGPCCDTAPEAIYGYRALSPMWGTVMKLLAPGFRLAQHWLF